MQHSKLINIFLASSITELSEERKLLGDYLMNAVRPIFRYDEVNVELLKCEDMNLGFTGVPTQTVINEMLKGCNYFIFVFKQNAGEQTRLEYEVVRAIQKAGNPKNATIRVYILEGPDEGKKQELIDFQKKLKKEGLYWATYKNPEDLRGQVEHHLIQFERQLLGKTKPSIVEQESETEKDADILFANFMQDEEKQSQRKEKIHQNIEDLLQQTETVMANEEETIAARIFKVIELYKKADLWAAITDYDKEKYSDLLFNYAGFLYDYGLYKDAEAVYLRQIPLVEELFGERHENAATSYNNIGMVYDEQGDYNKALGYYRKALFIYENALGVEHPDTATLFNNIGMVYDEQGDFKIAMKYHLKALNIREKILGMEHLDTAASYNNIGMVYNDQGDYTKALEYYHKALVIRERALGIEHPDTATSYNNIGWVYMEQAVYDKALEYYFKDLAICEKILGKEHPDTAISYNNIGWVYRKQGDYKTALNYYTKAYQIRKEKLGEEHPDTKSVMKSINYVKKAMKSFSDN